MKKPVKKSPAPKPVPKKVLQSPLLGLFLKQGKKK